MDGTEQPCLNCGKPVRVDYYDMAGDGRARWIHTDGAWSCNLESPKAEGIERRLGPQTRHDAALDALLERAYENLFTS